MIVRSPSKYRWFTEARSDSAEWRRFFRRKDARRPVSAASRQSRLRSARSKRATPWAFLRQRRELLVRLKRRLSCDGSQARRAGRMQWIRGSSGLISHRVHSRRRLCVVRAIKRVYVVVRDSSTFSKLRTAWRSGCVCFAVGTRWRFQLAKRSTHKEWIASKDALLHLGWLNASYTRT